MGMGLKTKYRKATSTIKYMQHVVSSSLNEDIRPLLLAHALEKGMGIPNVRKGYGKEKAEILIRELNRMITEKNTDCYAFKESLAILKAYFVFHESQNTDVSELKQKAEKLLEMADTDYAGGYRILSKEELLEGTHADIEKLFYSRHSIRTYSKDPITREELTKVIALTKRAPSACNREPWKFYTSLSPAICQQIAAAVPKQSFLDGIPYFGVVTVDRGLFYPKELNQWYVNGGIFLGYLSLAFHSCGIGSCIFQFPVLSDTTNDLKQKLGIHSTEEIIAVVGYGKFADETKCILADRRPDTDVLKLI